MWVGIIIEGILMIRARMTTREPHVACRLFHTGFIQTRRVFLVKQGLQKSRDIAARMSFYAASISLGAHL